MTGVSPRRLDEHQATVEAAHQEVYRLCRGGRWTMRVPVDEARDSDTVIEAGLNVADDLIAAVRAGLAQADQLDSEAVTLKAGGRTSFLQGQKVTDAVARLRAALTGTTDEEGDDRG